MCQISDDLQERNQVLSLEYALRESGYVFTVEDVRSEQEVLCWIKDKDQRMLAVSPAYERHIGISDADYRGSLDKEHHGEGQTYQDHDELVYLQKLGLTFVETWVNAEGVTESGIVLKLYQWDPKTKQETTYGEVLRILKNSDGRNERSA